MCRAKQRVRLNDAPVVNDAPTNGASIWPAGSEKKALLTRGLHAINAMPKQVDEMPTQIDAMPKQIDAMPTRGSNIFYDLSVYWIYSCL